MPKFEIEVPHALPLSEVRSRLEKATPKLESDYSARCTWEAQERLLVARKGLQATVHLEPTRLRVDIELGFLLSPLSASIRNGITRQLTDLMAQPDPAGKAPPA